jgi:hypothetical protein
VAVRSVSAGDSWRLAGAQLKLGYKRIRPGAGGLGQLGKASAPVVGRQNGIEITCESAPDMRGLAARWQSRGVWESRWGPSRMRGLNTYDVTPEMTDVVSPRPPTTPATRHLYALFASSSEVRPQHALLATARG